MDIYNRFANIYDELMMDFNYEDWFNYIEQIFKKYNKEPKQILEMACGTGNLSYYLAKQGYRLTCFDLSSDMLSKAYEKLRKFKNVKLINQNMINFNLKESFDSIISICDSINYITEKEDLFKTFKNVWNHLEDDGIFIFDINSHYKLKHIIGNNTFIEDKEEVFYSWQNYYDDNEDICEFYLTFFYSEDGENFERFDEEHREKAYEEDEIRELLKEAGFRIIDSFEAFGFEKTKDETERINFVAIK
ncbi:methyltransferase domain-containing protein [Tissierella sp. MB52-C2]|uniref:class I SAM-dependent DNA methyltransferase n=1 Tax=Tissierella sp. MB52-C2 TaxID=3070999 RepID=UPI00280A8DF1|nr:methyltransferase domain-containing protein [Tissierella sp. MB52-C2]WMM23681.1 methyltransferase domain-containing protein [Tissierella sp. MB52-C2]